MLPGVVLALLPYVDHAFVCCLRLSVSALRAIQIVTSELNTLTSVLSAVKCGIESGGKTDGVISCR